MSNPVFDSPDRLYARYLLDQFTTNDATPVNSPRVCEPGPGILTFVQATSTLSISGGALQISAPVPVALGAQGFFQRRPFKRRPGLALLTNYRNNSNQIIVPALTNKPQIPQGASYPEVEYGWQLFNGETYPFIILGKSTFVYNATPFPSAMYYAIVLRSSGAFFLLKDGGLTNWTLVWVEDSKSARKVYPSYMNVNAVGELYGIEATYWTTNGWDSDFGIVTNYNATPVNGDELTTDADPLVKFTWTPVAAETLELDVRRSDADNRWIVRCSQAGGTIKLIERNAGVETERISALQTWTPGTPITIVIHARGTAFRMYSDLTYKGTYSSSFNQAATIAKVSGFATGAKFEAWPSYPTVPAISI